MTTTNVALSIQVVGGPTVAISESKQIEAYDKIDVVIDPGGVDVSVEIQPGSGTQINFLLIKSNLYSTATSALSYKVSDGTTDSSSITLDEPHLYLGKGMMGLLIAVPKILKFKNSDATKKASIEILIGRDATP